MTLTDAIGYAAAVVGTVPFPPQAGKTLRHRATRDLSMPSLVLLLTNCSLWLGYGVMKVDLPLILANSVTVSALALTVGAKVWFERGHA